MIDKFNKEKIYNVKATLKSNIFSNYEEVMIKNNLKYRVVKRNRLQDEISGTFIVQGALKDHQKFVDYMLKDEDIKEFRF